MADEKIWKPLELAKVTADYLATKGVPDAKLDAEILLCQALGARSRIELYAGFEAEVPPEKLARYREMVRRRAGREPVSRILGVREFMGLAFAVTPAVLSPRPETEHLVEAVVDFLQPQKIVLPPETAPEEEDAADLRLDGELEKLLDQYAEDADTDDVDPEAEPFPVPPPRREQTLREAARSGAWKQARPVAPAGDSARPQSVPAGRLAVLDLGSGSGCIAAAVAAKVPAARVTATDVSPEALTTARENIRALDLAERVEFRLGAWYEACRDGERFDAVVSNPPYLVEGDPDIWPEASRFDPALALYGGADGLECYRELAAGAAERLRPGGKIFLEVGAGQAPFVRELLLNAGLGAIETIRDYGGVERVVVAARGR